MYLPDSFVDANTNCKIFSYDPSNINNPYSCATQCDFKPIIMTLTSGSYACPKTTSPNYWDDNCDKYTELLYE